MTSQSSPARREFLQKLTAIAGGSAALALSATSLRAAPIEKPAETRVEPARSKGYQHTQHVDTFYQLADF